MPAVESLDIDLTGRNERLRAALAASTRDIGRYANRVGTTLTKLGRQSGLAATGFAAGFGLIAKRSIEAASRVENLRLSVRSSAESVQELQFAFRLADLDADRLNKILTRVSQSVVDLNLGLSTMVDGFGLLGLEAKDFEGLTPDQVFLRIVRAMRETDDTVNALGAATKVLGARFASDLGKLQAADVEGLAIEARRLGAVMSGEVVKASADWGDEMSKLSDVLRSRFTEGLVRSLGGTQNFNKFIIAAGERAEQFAASVINLGVAIYEWRDGILSVVTALTLITGAKIAGSFIGFLRDAISLAWSMVRAVGSAVLLLFSWPGALLAAAAALGVLTYALTQSQSETRASVASVGEEIEAFWGQLIAVSDLRIAQFINTVGAGIRGAINVVLDTFESGLNEIIAAFDAVEFRLQAFFVRIGAIDRVPDSNVTPVRLGRLDDETLQLDLAPYAARVAHYSQRRIANEVTGTLQANLDAGITALVDGVSDVWAEVTAHGERLLETITGDLPPLLRSQPVLNALVSGLLDPHSPINEGRGGPVFGELEGVERQSIVDRLFGGAEQLNRDLAARATPPEVTIGAPPTDAELFDAARERIAAASANVADQLGDESESLAMRFRDDLAFEFSSSLAALDFSGFAEGVLTRLNQALADSLTGQIFEGLGAAFGNTAIGRFFAGTLHEGGFVPGSPGAEVPILAQAGELVLTPAQQRAVLGSGGPSAVTVNVAITGDVTDATRRALPQLGRELADIAAQQFAERRVPGFA